MKKLFACISLVMLLYSCNTGGSGSPKGTVEAFIAAAKTGNMAEVKKYITKSDVSLLEMAENMMTQFNPSQAAEMKEKMSKEFKEKTKDAKIDVKDEKIDGDKATVNVAFVNDGKTEEHPFSLVKEDGVWKISLTSTGMGNSGATDKDIDAMKNMNMDSLKGAISQGMKELSNMNKDSLKKAMEELKKINTDSLRKVMEEGMKELDKLKENPNKN